MAQHGGANPVMSQYMAYDEYVLHQGIGNSLVFDDDGVSLDAFKAHNVMAIPLCNLTMEKGQPKTPMLPGEVDPLASYIVASEISKKIARSLILQLKQLEADGKCLAVLSSHHVRVAPSGIVKFRGVQVLSNLNLAAREALLQQNYDSASDIIDGLFGKKIPKDIAHLTNLMRTEFGLRDMFPVHGGLVPMTSFPNLFLHLHEYAEMTIPKHHFHAILGELRNDPDVRNWRNLVGTNRVLATTLNYKQGSSYFIPVNFVGQTALHPDQKKALEKLGIPGGNLQVLTPQHLDLIRCLRFFDFMRNRIAHRVEALLAARSNFYVHQQFTTKGSETVTRVRFPLAIPIIQLYLRRHGLLSQLDLEPFFG